MEINGICRICLCNMLQIHSVSVFYKINVEKTILQVISDIASIEVSEEDRLPKFLCLNCYQKLLSINSFRELILFSDFQLKQRIFHEIHSYQNLPTVGSLSSEHDIVVKNENCESKNILPVEIYIKEEPQLEEPTSENVLEAVNHSTDNRFKEMADGSVDLFNGNRITESPNKNGINNLSKKLVKKHKCEICGKMISCRSASDLKRHMVVHSEITNYNCEFCPKKFKYRLTYIRHRSLHTGEKAMKCLICGMSFETYPKLCSHRATHTNSKTKIKKFKCDSCNIKSFYAKRDLEDHQRKVHTGEKPFLCELCSGAYSSQTLLNMHRMVVHEKTEKCNKCGRMYSANRIKSHLKRHQDREMGIKRFACEKCGQRFTCFQSLKVHYVIHAGTRPYSCEVCKKSFTQKAAAVTHMKVHSDVRKFICEYCPKTFKYKHHLQIHTAKHHKKDDEQMASKHDDIYSSTDGELNSAITRNEDES